MIRFDYSSPFFKVQPPLDPLENELGDDVEPNEEDVRLFRFAAEQGSGHAQTSLGNCYVNGLGVAQDINEGAKWLLKAVKGENSEKQPIGKAQYYYARLLHHVAYEPVIYQLLPENVEDTCIEWYMKSAELGIVDAQYMLTLYYVNLVYTARSSDEKIDAVDDAKILFTAMDWLRCVLNRVIEDEELDEIIEKDALLIECIEKEMEEVVLAYLESGMDLNSILSYNCLTPLELSMLKRSESIAKILIEHGVDLNTTLHESIKPNDLMSTMTNAGHRNNAELLMGELSFPLAQACKRCMHKTQMLLMNNGANIHMVKFLMVYAEMEFSGMDSRARELLEQRL